MKSQCPAYLIIGLFKGKTRYSYSKDGGCVFWSAGRYIKGKKRENTVCKDGTDHTK
jgi:hypothetical protein